MPWTPAQHRLFEAAAHDPAIARARGIPQSSAARMAAEGIKKRQGGLASLSHDDVEEYGVGGLVNKIARLVQRPLTRPAFTTEAVSSSPLDELHSDYRHALALGQARAIGHDDLAQLPIEKGQGAWLNDKGELEKNPLYMQRLPRTMGRIDQDEPALGYAADMGQLLEQHAVPVLRAIPGVVNTPDGANAVIASGVDRGGLTALADALARDAVVAHQPGGKAALFYPGGGDIEALLARAKAALPGAKYRYGVSDEGVDRAVVGDDPSWNIPYANFGSNPRTPAYSELERMLMNSDAPARDAGLTPLP